MTRENMGADPEFMVVDKDGNFVPAHRVGIPPKKEKDPTYYNNYGAGHQFFRDGAVVEVNTTHPSTCRAGLISSVQASLFAARDALPRGYSLKATASMPVDLDDLMRDAPPDVMEFGCNPSYDAYTGLSKYPGDAANIPFRFA